jgi:hypothetical protein
VSEHGASSEDCRPVGGTATDWLDQRGKEGRVGVAADLGDEDAGEGAPGEVAVDGEVVGVDDGTPGAADALARDDGASGEAAEDVEEYVVAS